MLHLDVVVEVPGEELMLCSIGEETYAGEKITDEPTWIGTSTSSLICMTDV